MLKILVCVKQVPDVDQMRMDPETGSLIRTGVPAILNPLDGNALSAAVKVKETYGGEITLITLAASVILMGLCGVILLVFKQKWIESYALPISILGSLAIAFAFIPVFA